MKHMNPKLVKLLYEGFSINTLEKLDNQQLDSLYKRVMEQSSAPLNISKTDTAGIAKAKAEKKPFVTYEEEIEESEIEEKSVSKKQRGLMGAAYSVEKGDKELKDIPKSYRGKVEKVVKSMTKKQIGDFAKTSDEEISEDKKFIQKAVKKMEKKGTEGSFKKYCGGEVTKDCIKKGLNSDDPKIVKRANFANNIKAYKGAEHNESDEVKKLEENILRILENHLPPHTTKGELVNLIKRRK